MKAREIIPGWPRGRSTSRLYWTTLQRMRVMYENYHGHQKLHLSMDRRWAEAEATELAEDQRKADMMEGFYRDQRRIIADGRFNLFASRGERYTPYGYTVHAVVAEAFAREIEVQPRAHLFAEPTVIIPQQRTVGPLNCGCCPGGKHQP